MPPSPSPTSPSRLFIVEPVPTTAVSIGEVIRTTIGLADPVCDPKGWDATAPCKRFLLVAPRDGVLTVILSAEIPGTRSDVIDLMLISPSGPYAYSGGGAEQEVSTTVVGGNTYEIRVNSYPYLLPVPGNLEFELKIRM